MQPALLCLLSTGFIRNWRWTFWLILVPFMANGILRLPHCWSPTRGDRARSSRRPPGSRLVQLCYTRVQMDSTKKTAVSLPRTLADRAERAARRRGIPRSRLYALALEAFLVDEHESDEELTAQINAVLASEATRSVDDVAEDQALEAWLNEAGRRAWDSVEWKE
jgi:hypothetical protein